MRVTRGFQLEKWQVSLGLIALSLILYVISCFLIRYFIGKRAPEFASDEHWESTAGLGIVPKWVSVLGLLSISAFITAVMPLVVAIVGWVIGSAILLFI